MSLASSLIASKDGGTVDEFDYQGRHVSTQDATNGQKLLSLSYGSDGLLSSVTDANHNKTTFDRSTKGKVVIQAPFGQRTALLLDKDGYAESFADPAGSKTSFTYVSSGGNENGLLETLTDPKGQVHHFTFTIGEKCAT